MDSLVRLMNSTAGRLLRIGLGVALIAYGLLGLGGMAGYVIAAIGLLPIALGVSGRCLVELVAPKR